jgi:cold shock protein
LKIPPTPSICAAFDILPVLAAGPTQALSKTTLNSDGRCAMVAQPGTPIGVFKGGPNMAQGTVKFFNTQKGYGFIQPTDGGKDVFVHISAVERAGMSDLHEGQKVSYDVVSERGKLAAANLQSI